MKKFLNNNLLVIIGAVIGSVVGYAYYHFVGCLSGTCPITSIWYVSTIYGSIMGGLLFSMFKSVKEEV